MCTFSMSNYMIGVIFIEDWVIENWLGLIWRLDMYNKGYNASWNLQEN